MSGSDKPYPRRLKDNAYVAPKDNWTRIGMPLELGALADRIDVPFGDVWFTGKASKNLWLDCECCKAIDGKSGEPMVIGQIDLTNVVLRFTGEPRIYSVGRCWRCGCNYVEVA
jgi:hypothetical protein